MDIFECVYYLFHTTFGENFKGKMSASWSLGDRRPWLKTLVKVQYTIVQVFYRKYYRVFTEVITIVCTIVKV